MVVQECQLEDVDHVWERARLATLARDGWTCTHEGCGATDWNVDLEVHHLTPVKDDGGYAPGCQHHRDNLVTLCHRHHVHIEMHRRRTVRFADGWHGQQRALDLAV